MNGYIKLFREFENWEWYQDNNTKSVFIHILLNVNIKPSRYKGYELKAGQGVFGINKMSAFLGLTVQQTRTALSHLKSTNEITIKPTNKFSIITVENWGKYQFNEIDNNNQNNKQITNKQHSNNIQLTTEEEYKNIRNKEYKNNSCSSIRDLLSDDDINRIRSILDNNINNADDLFDLIDRDYKLKDKSIIDIEQPFKYVMGVAIKKGYITKDEYEQHLLDLLSI